MAGAVFGDVELSLFVADEYSVKFGMIAREEIRKRLDSFEKRFVRELASFVWQARSLVKFKCHFSWQVQHLVKFKCRFSWQAHYLVKFKCHFSWQVHRCVKFGMIAGARNVVFFNRKYSWRARKVTSLARRVAE